MTSADDRTPHAPDEPDATAAADTAAGPDLPGTPGGPTSPDASMSATEAAATAVRPGLLGRWRATHPAPPPGVRRRRWGRWSVLALVALLISAVVGVTTASAESSLGPHEARYDVTTDSEITIDLGPFGTLVIDSPLPLTLGARVTVQEIPADVDALHDIDTLQALSGDLQSYLQFFTGPQATIADAAKALALDALRRTALVMAGMLVAGWAVRRFLGPTRRRELLATATAHRREGVAGIVVVALVVTLVTSSEAGREPGREVTQAASTVFDGTPLEGARITGRLGGIIDTYGGLVVKAYRENEEFYQQADDSLVAAWDEWEQGDDPERVADGDDSTAVTAEPTAEPTEDAGAEATTAESATTAPPSPSPTGTEAEPAEPLTLLVIADLHCNVGMAPLITTMTELSGAAVVLDAGDTSMNGTSVEQYCVSTIARAVPDGVDLVTAPGNHDSPETSAQYARAGATVLDGGVVEVQGMRILGDSDPKVTRVGETTVQAESYPDVAARLSEVACDDADGVDLVLFHNPRVGPSLLADGCIPALVSGHMHTRTDPEQIGEGIRYISSSTAGAVDNEPRIGPLRGTAEMTLLHWDPTSRRILDWQLIEIGTDASAVVHDPVRWPVAVPDPDPEADEAPTGGATDGTTTAPAGD